ncbi:ArsC/Spx/MgsR family protein [uncultured Algimonas sp.]|uniref:ArsC/Spx/MgsR family protein n=1 Tax=uncultured Algimonas sp. TaxID=1547920 RepID=UPI00263116C3|nr:ArsC/Spx/MgsR family protein [uncultured Algimonas sp.]
MKVFALKNCDTCRKARKEMDTAGVGYELVDVRADTLDTQDIAAIVDAVGYEKALNRRSTTWRALDDPAKTGLDNVKAVQLIEAHPTLLKRPAIMDGDTVTVGWDDTAKSTWL